MYEALNNVRIMSRASHKDTDKRKVNQINESKWKFKAKERDLSRCEDYIVTIVSLTTQNIYKDQTVITITKLEVWR